MVQQNELQWIAREFETVDITDQYMVVIAATDNREVNHQISRICLEQRILCNVVDQPDEGSFIVPSTVERGPLTIGISTSGISPTLASSIRQELEMAYGEEYGTFLEFMSTVRQQVIDLFPLPKQRQKIFDRMTPGRFPARSGMKEAALKELQHIIDEGGTIPPFPGRSVPLFHNSEWENMRQFFLFMYSDSISQSRCWCFCSSGSQDTISCSGGDDTTVHPPVKSCPVPPQL